MDPVDLLIEFLMLGVTNVSAMTVAVTVGSVLFAASYLFSGQRRRRGGKTGRPQAREAAAEAGERANDMGHACAEVRVVVWDANAPGRHDLATLGSE